MVSARSRMRSPLGASKQVGVKVRWFQYDDRVSGMERLQAPAVDSDPPTFTITQSVACERCSRSVLVGLSPLYPPRFRHVDEQVGCPEIHERRGKNGESGLLLLMMCGALKRSLDSGCEGAEVRAVAHDRRWRVVCQIAGVASANYSPHEARNRAKIWDCHGNKKLAVALRAAAAKAERRQSSRARAAIGIGAVAIAAAGSWFLLVMEPRLAQSPAAPQPLEHPDATAAESKEASSEAARSQVPEPEASIASPEVPRAAPAAGRTSAADPKPRVPEMVSIPGGKFVMGGSEASELPVHQVTVGPFALGKFPVMVGEWKECVAAKACADLAAGPDDNPVTNVSYNDAQDYLAWLSRVAGKPFRLPSEAEWEYAARGGQRTKFWWGDQMRVGMANCTGCNEADDASQPLKVGRFQANPFSLFDMGGGIDQWVADSWHKDYQGAPVDGSAWVDEKGFVRVIRSGSWKNDASYVRPGSRDNYDARIRYPTHGFRVALSP
jgi:formylglycine-generating enzyme required for sulfatase activity